MLGGYVCVVLPQPPRRVPFLAALPGVTIASALAGVVLERTLYRPTLRRLTPRPGAVFHRLVFMSISIAHFFFGAQQQPLQLPPMLSGQFNPPGVDVGVYRLFLIVIGQHRHRPAMDDRRHPLSRPVARLGRQSHAPRAVWASTSIARSCSPLPLVPDSVGSAASGSKCSA